MIIMDTLTDTQHAILAVLRDARSASGTDGTFTYLSEWLGYLPYGHYHSATMGDDVVSDRFPSNWELSDLHALVHVGAMEHVGGSSPDDPEADHTLVYRLRS